MPKEKVLLYMPLLKCYLSHGLKVTAIHKYLKYEPRKPFEWLSEEVSQARCDGDNNPALKQVGDTFKVKGNLFYRKMIKNLMKQKTTIFTTNEDLINKSFRSPFFKDLEEIHGTLEIREHKQRVNIT